MKLPDAKAECERWFAYLDSQRERAIAFQKLAARVRSGDLTTEDARREQRKLDDAGLRVYDGAKLEQAVKLLLKHVKA